MVPVPLAIVGLPVRLLRQRYVRTHTFDAIYRDPVLECSAGLARLQITHLEPFGASGPFATVDLLPSRSPVRSRGLDHSWLRCKGFPFRHAGSLHDLSHL